MNGILISSRITTVLIPPTKKTFYLFIDIYHAHVVDDYNYIHPETIICTSGCRFAPATLSCPTGAHAFHSSLIPELREIM